MFDYVNPILAIAALVVTTLTASHSYGKRWRALTTGLRTMDTEQHLADLRRDSVLYGLILIVLLAALTYAALNADTIGDHGHRLAWAMVIVGLIFNGVAILANRRELAATA